MILWPSRSTKPPSVPWVPSRDEVIKTLLELIRPREKDIFYDVGCGDGRVAISVSKKFKIKTKCIELRKDLVEKGRKTAEDQNVGSLVDFIEDDFFTVPISDATIVYMYLLTSVNAKLRPKLERELENNTIVISLDFPITGWQPIAVLDLPRSWQRTLYIYVKGISDTLSQPIGSANLENVLPESVRERLNLKLIKSLLKY